MTLQDALAGSLLRDRTRVRGTVVVALLLLEVFLAVWSVYLAPEGTNVGAFWPNSGVSVVALVLALPSWRPWVAGGIFVANALGNLEGGRPLDLSLAYGALNAAEAALVVWLLTRRGRPAALETLEDFIRFAGAALAGSLLGGFIGAASVVFLADGQLFATWRAILASHTAAILVVTPLALRLPRHIRRPAGPVEAGIQWGVLAGVAALVFSPGQELPLEFLMFPVLVWGAARLRPREVTLQLFLSSALISLLTTQGNGPFHETVQRLGLPPEMVGTLLQAHVLAAALVTLPLSLVKTSRLITLERLRQSNRMINNIVDATTSTAILGTDLVGRVEFFNVGAENLSGYRAGDVVGHACIALPPSPDGRRMIRIAVGADPDPLVLEGLIQPFLQGFEGNITNDWHLERADGELRTVSLAISRRLGPAGEPVGYLGVANDVTDRRRQEEAVASALAQEKQLNDQLAQLDETKNDFLSTVSHELRTPVTSIIGYSQLLMSDETGSVPATHQQILHRIERNGRRLMGLVEDMLTMSQLELGDFRVREGSVDLRSVVTRAVDSVADSLEARHLGLERQLGADEVLVNGDATKLERAFTNLLTNAVKFSHEGDTVTVRLRADGDEVLVEVADTGIGISDEDRVHLFDRFFRGEDARQRAIQGAGLGLTVTDSIITAHRGSIEVESTLGQGTSFTVRLPRLATDGSTSVA